ncbi:protein adenylyltransferase SelO family protein [Pseudoalteromonas sp. Hal099]
MGTFSPRLGDGRAHLLGAISDDKNQLWDIRVKALRRHAFQEERDGRCALSPAIREVYYERSLCTL